MSPSQFIESVPNFLNLSKVDQVVLFAWYLQAHQGLSAFSAAQLRGTFRSALVEPPDLAVYLPRLASKIPPQLRRVGDKFRLDEKLRRKLNDRHGMQPTTVLVTSLLASLPEKVPDLIERAFLVETLNCYKVKAYRAATVMAWNLAFDHVQRWILKSPVRLVAFNNSLATKYPQKRLSICRIEDFESLKEFEVIETIKHSSQVTDNLAGILKEKLNKRNRAAHPSNIEVTQYQADDAITDLVNNVVLALN